MRPITVIGIDPGASGALCFTSSEKKDMYTYKCHPSIAGRRVTASMAANAYRSYETIAYKSMQCLTMVVVLCLSLE